jgi:hypothetical protein
MTLEVGDVIVWHGPGCQPVRREILSVRPTGYDWRYPDLGEVCFTGHPNRFASDQSTDPLFSRPEWAKEMISPGPDSGR